MKELIKSKYFKWGLTACITLVSALLVFFLIDKLPTVHEGMAKIISIISPFIYGIVMAYLLRPVYDRCYHGLNWLVRKKISEPNHIFEIIFRAISVTASVLLLLAVIAYLIMTVFPQLATSLYSIIMDAPDMAKDVRDWFYGIEFKNPEMRNLIMNYIDQISDYFDKWLDKTLIPYLKDLALKVSAGIIVAASTIFKILIGIIVCVYLLLSKGTFSAQGKKILFSLFEKDTANAALNGFRFADKVFKGFVVGNIIDSTIIGLITFIGMTILNLPFPLFVATVVGVTNLIPFFGPFIGAVPCAILLFTEKPVYCLYFIIMILVIQQLDGNIIKPKVLGQSVNLPSFWILFSIIVGGGLFGFVGMILGVPIFTLIYSFVEWIIEKRLRRKDLPVDSFEYAKVDYYDFDKGEFQFLPDNMLKEKRKEKQLDRIQRQEKKKIEREKQAEKLNAAFKDEE